MVDACNPWSPSIEKLGSYIRCGKTTSNIKGLWCIGKGWCFLLLNDIDVTLPMSRFLDLCVQVFAYGACWWLTSIAQNAHTLANIGWRWPMKMLPSLCRSAPTDACRPWLMLHSFVQYRLQDVKMSCQMSTCLGWCCLSFDDVAFLKCTSVG